MSEIWVDCERCYGYGFLISLIEDSGETTCDECLGMGGWWEEQDEEWQS